MYSLALNLTTWEISEVLAGFSMSAHALKNMLSGGREGWWEYSEGVILVRLLGGDSWERLFSNH